RTEARLSSFGHGSDRLPDERAENDQIAARALHARHLRREVGGAALVRGLFNPLQVDRLQALLGALEVLDAVVVVLVNDAGLLERSLLDEQRHGLACLVEVRREGCELQAVHRIEHLPARAEWE